MKNEINLRTREFTITREFYLPRLLVAIAVVFLVTLVLGGSIFIYLYQMQLAVEINNLAQERASLQALVNPLEELERKISDIEKRESLDEYFQSNAPPWSGCFKMIYRIAGENGVQITHLSTGSEGKVIIRGESVHIHYIPLFMQALVANQGGGVAIHKHMRYPQNDQFGCEIELTVPSGGGGDR